MTRINEQRRQQRDMPASLAGHLSIDMGCLRQRLDGFGASGAWWAQAVGRHPGARDQVLDWLFHPTRGIGLTVYRHTLGGGKSRCPDPWRRAETHELAPGCYDWGRDAAAITCLEGAVQRGVSDVVLFANSPTARMTVSGGADGHPRGASNLRPELLEDFARSLVDISQHFLERLGLPQLWLSPINEPQWDWHPGKGQEGCHYTPQECAGLAAALVAELAARPETRVRLSLLDSATWEGAPPYLVALLGRPEVRAAMPHFSVHSYFNDAGQKELALAAIRALAPDLPLWMSEWTEMRSGRDEGMDSALTLARVMHEDLTLCEVTSWQAWIAVSKYDFRDGLIYVDEDGDAPLPAKRLWALGQFSRFVRPGARRLETSAEGLPGDLLASAYLSADGNTLSAVLINPQGGVGMTVSVPEGFVGSSARLFVTDGTRDLAETWREDAKSTLTLALPARSVATLVLSRPAIPTRRPISACRPGGSGGP